MTIDTSLIKLATVYTFILLLDLRKAPVREKFFLERWNTNRSIFFLPSPHHSERIMDQPFCSSHNFVKRDYLLIHKLRWSTASWLMPTSLFYIITGPWFEVVEKNPLQGHSLQSLTSHQSPMLLSYQNRHKPPGKVIQRAHFWIKIS